MGKNKHNLVFIEMLESIKKLSDDRKTQVASLIVNRNNDIISYGVNSLPDGVIYNEERCTSPLKNHWMMHAERNALYKAARLGISTMNANMYCTYFPCADCSRAIIQGGIKKLYTEKPDFNHHKWGESWIESLTMLIECDVEVIWTNEVTYYTGQYIKSENIWYLAEHCKENGVVGENYFTSKEELCEYTDKNGIIWKNIDEINILD